MELKGLHKDIEKYEGSFNELEYLLELNEDMIYKRYKTVIEQCGYEATDLGGFTKE